MVTIFIGFDSRMEVASDVCAFSLRKHSSKPLDIRFLKLRELNLRRPEDPLASTEFTYTRFLVPHLMGFKGTALFMDNDMLAFADIHEILDLPMDRYALRVVKHDYKPKAKIKMDGKPQTQYPRKNWSSMMLMDCAKLTCWSKYAVETMKPSWLHRFEAVPDELIGDLPSQWNVLDEILPDTKLIHYTEGGPWFDECRGHPFASPWFRYRNEMGLKKYFFPEV